MKNINFNDVLYLENDILYFEAIDTYVKVHTVHHVYLLHATIRSLEEKIPVAKFVRVHPSYIVSLSKIESIQNGVITINNNSVPIDDIYRTGY